MKLLDVVALLENLPEVGLYRGQVGTIVEQYEPQVFEVEFSDNDGKAYAIETLNEHQLMVLYHDPINPEKVAV
ncbi:DUF4926 domain-containing protein [Roseofilum sp. BLCC_M91]|uniref:DUF4926 domain-containing protein n=1 Tax=Roseofilum halophilum BLCC-M91 TaxID=3022259 RepID=A0ABT7BQG9_9CYAN|nr:DUF4926 domain-containing protein [Roseofilum halophilum]MDJ1180769.1 DUF4926 domain-containing protein [Roseofilum halophilum BLCC-M91]